MPIYTYQCEDCGERFEAKQSFNDAPQTICPTCEGKIHRVIQPVGVVFKGSGFYVTDSRGKQNLATNGSKKEEGKSSESSGSNGGGENGSTSTSTEKAAPAAESTTTTTKSETSAKPSTSSSTSE
jgi:putative FmdB family regulatory protein